MLFRFFDFLFMFILTRPLSKSLRKNYHSSIQFFKINFKMYMLQNIKMSNAVIPKGSPLNIKQNLKKYLVYVQN